MYPTSSTEIGLSIVEERMLPTLGYEADKAGKDTGASHPQKGPFHADGPSRSLSGILSHNLSANPNEADYVGDTERASFPQLSNTSPTSPKPALGRTYSDGDDDEFPCANGFQRSSSPLSGVNRTKYVPYGIVGDEKTCRMQKFSLYETASRFYLVGGNTLDLKFRILKIDRTADLGDLSIVEDDIVYTKKEMDLLLNTIDDGNKSSGGLKLRCSTWGLLGFIRFTGAYYMLIITKRSPVAMIGGHYVYQVNGTDLISLTTMTSSSRMKVDRDPEEARFIGILNNLDLSRSFYFSYSYDITHTLQHNILFERETLHHDLKAHNRKPRNAMFMWNHHLLETASKSLNKVHDWCLPIVHGFVDQASIYSVASFMHLSFLTESRSSFSIWSYCLHHNHRTSLALLRRCKVP